MPEQMSWLPQLLVIGQWDEALKLQQLVINNTAKIQIDGVKFSHSVIMHCINSADSSVF